MSEFEKTVDAALEKAIEEVGGIAKLYFEGTKEQIGEARQAFWDHMKKIAEEYGVAFQGISETHGGMIPGDWMHITYCRKGEETREKTFLFTHKIHCISVVDELAGGRRRSNCTHDHH